MFSDDLAAGRVEADDIHEYIEAWHEAPADSDAAQLALHEYLGLTWQQYVRWAMTGAIERDVAQR